MGDFLSLLERLSRLLERLLKATDSATKEHWIDNLEAAVDQLENAKNAQQKLDAAAAAVGVIRKLD